MQTVQTTLNKNNTRQKTHLFYLLLSALLVASGVIVGLFYNGELGKYTSSFQAGGLRYFTYLANILVILAFVTMAFCGDNKFRYYLSFCTMVAITVTGLVYNFVLFPSSPASNPIIFKSYHNFINHFSSMVLVLVNYFVFEKKGFYSIKHLLIGLIFPFVYWIIFISIGNAIDFYPYFFMDTSKLGIPMLIVWLLALLAAFVLLGYLLVWYDKKKQKNNTK